MRTNKNKQKPKIVRYPSETWYILITAARLYAQILCLLTRRLKKNPCRSGPTEYLDGNYVFLLLLHCLFAGIARFFAGVFDKEKHVFNLFVFNVFIFPFFYVSTFSFFHCSPFSMFPIFLMFPVFIVPQN